MRNNDVKMVASFIAFLMAQSTTSFSQDIECVDVEFFLEAADSTVFLNPPCDAIGLSYLIGLDYPIHEFDVLPPIHVPENLEYYPFFRSYLRAKSNDGYHVSDFDKLGFLLLGLAELAPSGSEARVDQVRASYYAAFVLLEYALSSSNTNSKNNELFAKSVGQLLNGATFDSVEELRCFIRFDVPTLSVDDVLTSKIFKSCRGE